MIKRCLVIFFAVLGFVMHADANIKILPAAADAAIKEMFTQEKDKASALATFNANVQPDGSISALAIWKVCAAGGLNYDKEQADKAKCKQLLKKLLKEGSFVEYYEVCGKDKGKSKGTEYCVDDFFTNKWMPGGIQVQMSIAISLAQEYARIKDKDDSVICSNTYREVGNDDAIKCTSQNKNVFYEFVFDDVKESSDDTIRKNTQTAVCKLYGVESVEPVCDSANGRCIGAVCKADEPTCEKINKSLQKFGLSSKFVYGKCSVSYDGLSKKSQLKTAFGIDNFAFCKGMGIQVGNEPAVDKYLKDYIAKQAGISANEVTCDPGFKTYTGQGCNVGVFSARDDVKTCHAKGQQVDFVFDDINELWETYKKGGVQAMSCKVSGGTYAGKRCIGLGKAQCDLLKQSNIATCPQCKAAEWDEATQSCVLPSAEDAVFLEKGVNISIMVGGAVVGVVVTVATGGAGAAIVLTGIETVGSAIEITSQLQINGIADDFLVESNKCRSASCAERIINQNLQRMSNIANDLLDAESAAVDSEFVRLINLLPNNATILKKLVGDEGALAKNKKGFFDADSWEPEQVWRAVGQGLQLASVMTSLWSWAGKKMPRATNTLIDKARGVRGLLVNNADELTDVAKIVANNADEMTDAAKMVANNADEFAKIGIKETLVDGKSIYTDIKTGKQLTEAQVLNRIPSSLNDEFAKIGVKQIDVGKGGTRYIDTATGKFVSSDEVVKRIGDMPSSSASSWADDLASIGVKEVDGVYTDAKTGKQLTEAQVLNRIPSSLNDELAEIGVRQVDRGKYGTRYIDTATGHTVSSDEVVKRIGDMPSSSASSWADDLASIGVKEVDGVYTDIKTGKELTEAQVLNRIPSSLNDELAEIGVRQVDRGKYGTRYIDTATGHTVSSDEVVKRIGGNTVETASGKVVHIPDYHSKINVGVIDDAGVRAIYEKAYKAEPKITEDLLGVVSDAKGELHGLEYRIKTPESTLEKIMRDRVDLVAEKGALASNITDADIAGEFKDLVRYTFAAPKDDLVPETRRIMSELEHRGYKIEKVKNTFVDPNNPIDMINMRVVSPEGQVFELQANTPHNLHVKDNLMHKDYEAWRVIKDKSSPEAMEYSKKMFETAKQFEKPKGIESFH